MAPINTTHPFVSCSPYHVEVGYSSCSCPEHRASLDGPQPKEVGEKESKYGDSFIVVGASDRAGDVAGYDGDETCGQETSSSIPHLAGEKKGSYGCETTEGGRKKGRGRRQRERRK